MTSLRFASSSFCRAISAIAVAELREELRLFQRDVGLLGKGLHRRQRIAGKLAARREFHDQSSGARRRAQSRHQRFTSIERFERQASQRDRAR